MEGNRSRGGSARPGGPLVVLGRVVRLFAHEVTEQVTGSLLTCGFGGWDFGMLYPHVSKLVPLCFPLFLTIFLGRCWFGPTASWKVNGLCFERDSFRGEARCALLHIERFNNTKLSVPWRLNQILNVKVYSRLRGGRTRRCRQWDSLPC